MNCTDCQTPLPAGRFVLCAACDAKARADGRPGHIVPSVDLSAGLGALAAMATVENMPVRLRSASSDYERMHPAIKHLLAESPMVDLWIQGESHLGKSSGASLLAVQWAEQSGHPATFTSAHDIEHRRESGYGDFSRCRQMRELHEAYALVVDDIDKVTRWTEGLAMEMWHLIDARWANKRPTIVTAQRSIQAFCGAVATFDREAAKSLENRLKTYRLIHLKA